MSTGITRDEWLKAMHDAGMHDDVDDPSAVTIDEFAQMFSLPRTTAAYRLRALERAGKATQTAKRCLTSYGRRVRYIAYRLSEPPKKQR